MCWLTRSSSPGVVTTRSGRSGVTLGCEGLSTGPAKAMIAAATAAARKRSSHSGVRSVSVSGAGVFTGSTAETRIKNNALSGLLDDYELSFESGDRLRGKFLVARLDYAGDFNGERSYTLALESSGQVTSL